MHGQFYVTQVPTCYSITFKISFIHSVSVSRIQVSIFSGGAATIKH